MMIVLTILAIGKIFYADFGLFYQLPRNSGPLFPVTNVIDTYVYRALIEQGNISMSSAAGVYQSLVGFCVVMLSNWIVRKVDKDQALF
jgi:putative aldouronate transport system permease protein